MVMVRHRVIKLFLIVRFGAGCTLRLELPQPQDPAKIVRTTLTDWRPSTAEIIPIYLLARKLYNSRYRMG